MISYAYVERSGRIVFHESGSIDDMPILGSGDNAELYEVISALARHSYDGKTLLVPGIPEAESNHDALKAVERFSNEVSKRMPQVTS